MKDSRFRFPGTVNRLPWAEMSEDGAAVIGICPGTRGKRPPLESEAASLESGGRRDQNLLGAGHGWPERPPQDESGRLASGVPRVGVPERAPVGSGAARDDACGQGTDQDQPDPLIGQLQRGGCACRRCDSQSGRLHTPIMVQLICRCKTRSNSHRVQGLVRRSASVLPLTPCHPTIGSSLTGVTVQVQRVQPGSRSLCTASRLSASTM